MNWLVRKKRWRDFSSPSFSYCRWRQGTKDWWSTSMIRWRKNIQRTEIVSSFRSRCFSSRRLAFLFIKKESRKENLFLVNEINVVDSIDNGRHLSPNDKCCSFVRRKQRCLWSMLMEDQGEMKKKIHFVSYSNIRMGSIE